MKNKLPKFSKKFNFIILHKLNNIFSFDKSRNKVQHIRKHYTVHISNEILFAFVFLYKQYNVLLGTVLMLLQAGMLENVYLISLIVNWHFLDAYQIDFVVEVYDISQVYLKFSHW